MEFPMNVHDRYTANYSDSSRNAATTNNNLATTAQKAKNSWMFTKLQLQDCNKNNSCCLNKNPHACDIDIPLIEELESIERRMILFDYISNASKSGPM
jgi:hypothetical protein